MQDVPVAEAGAAHPDAQNAGREDQRQGDRDEQHLLAVVDAVLLEDPLRDLLVAPFVAVDLQALYPGLYEIGLVEHAFTLSGSRKEGGVGPLEWFQAPAGSST